MLILDCVTVQQDASEPSEKQMDRILKLKGSPKHLRQAILKLQASSTITMFYKHDVDQDGLEHMVRNARVDGKEISSSTYRYDWQLREGRKTEGLGVVFSKYRRTKLEDVDDPYLREGWLPESIQDGLLESHQESRVPVAWSIHSVSLMYHHVRKQS
jgi:hypothetical protein